MTTKSAPGKAFRKGISLFQLGQLFPNEQSAKKWFEHVIWQGRGPTCPKCKGHKHYTLTSDVSADYECVDCKYQYTVRIGTVMYRSKLPYRTWLYAIYLFTTSLKGVSSMKLHRDLGISQKTAWKLLQKIREGFAQGDDLFTNIAEVDEMFVGGKESNKHDKDKQNQGRGSVGKSIIVGVKERDSKKVKAKVIPDTKKMTLHQFIKDTVEEGSKVYTDEFPSYQGLKKYCHASVWHRANIYVWDGIHTNGIESFWSMFKRAHKGVYHKMSKKHLWRYVNEFATRQCIRELDTMAIMANIAFNFVGKQLPYKKLIV